MVVPFSSSARPIWPSPRTFTDLGTRTAISRGMAGTTGIAIPMASFSRGNHRVHKCGDRGIAGQRQLLGSSLHGVRRLLRRMLHLSSFSYLKYGEMRLFSQLAQDSQMQVGKVLWVAAPRARDSRGQAYALRRFLSHRDAALSGRLSDQSVPVGVQRGARRPRCRALYKGTDHRASPDASGQWKSRTAQSWE